MGTGTQWAWAVTPFHRPRPSPWLLSPPQPAVCTRELCVFSFYTLGVMSGAAEEVATGAEVGTHAAGDHAVTLGCCPFTPRSVPKVVDLLVAMCRAALESPRKSIIFEPYPSVVDPNDPKTLAFNPKVSAGGATLPRAEGQWGWGNPEDPSNSHPSPAPRVEEELRAAAEGPGQCDVHPGDDPGTLAWPRTIHGPA